MSGQGKQCGGKGGDSRQWEDALPLSPLSLSLGQRVRTVLFLHFVPGFLDYSAPSAGSISRLGPAVAAFPVPMEE